MDWIRTVEYDKLHSVNRLSTLPSEMVEYDRKRMRKKTPLEKVVVVLLNIMSQVVFSASSVSFGTPAGGVTKVLSFPV